MTNLEIQKLKLDINKLSVAKEEMEVKILERLEDIDRIKVNIAIQEEAIKRKQAELAESGK